MHHINRAQNNQIRANLENARVSIKAGFNEADMARDVNAKQILFQLMSLTELTIQAFEKDLE
jgi:hypothetical protein